MFNFFKKIFNKSKPLIHNEIQNYKIYFNYEDVLELQKNGDILQYDLINSQKQFYINFRTMYDLRVGMKFYTDISGIAYIITNKIDTNKFEAELLRV